MHIQWPSSETDKDVEKFWTRLQLCMPKKKYSAPKYSSNIRDFYPNGTYRTSVTDDKLKQCVEPESVTVRL